MHQDYSGYCPHIQNDNTIAIDYTEVLIARSMKKHFKRNGFECEIDTDEDDGCPYSNRNKCPLYEEAPVTIEK